MLRDEFQATTPLETITINCTEELESAYTLHLELGKAKLLRLQPSSSVDLS